MTWATSHAGSADGLPHQVAADSRSATFANGCLQTPYSIVKWSPQGDATDVTPPKTRKTAVSGRLVGYARVSTDEQGTDPQLDELRAAGCVAILEEHASGADRSRPVLARLLRDIRAGETLVVVRLDRLARSVGHLLAVIEHWRLPARISAAYAIRSTPPPHKVCSRCRCWGPSPSSSGH
jgi:hypothetical protein